MFGIKEEEIKSLIPVLLSKEQPPRVQLASGSRYVHFSTKQHDGKLEGSNVTRAPSFRTGIYL